MERWRCISGCGACCRLDPSLRGDDLDCLSPEQRSLYLEMVGSDGWCIHFDTGGRRCRIYDARPDFCRVENLMALFAASASQAPNCTVEVAAPIATEQGPQESLPGGPEATMPAAAQALAIASCRTQIRAEYGGRGRVMRRFVRVIRRQS